MFLSSLDGRVLPTFAFWRRCFHYLHRKASRRPVEAAFVVILLTQVIRIAQALRWMPPLPGRTGDNPALRFVLATNDFYRSLWPHPVFWFVVLLLASVALLAGIYQVTAAVLLVRGGGDPVLLAERGEDDPRYFQSVDPRWLLADVLLRRAAMLAGKSFFASIAWILFWHTGFGALVFLVFLRGCIWVDARLKTTQHQLQDLSRRRREAQRRAFLSLIAVEPRDKISDRVEGLLGH